MMCDSDWAEFAKRFPEAHQWLMNRQAATRLALLRIRHAGSLFVGKGLSADELTEMSRLTAVPAIKDLANEILIGEPVPATGP